MKAVYCTVLVLLMSSCSLFDSAQPEPLYLDMEAAQMVTTPGQGFNTHKINDVSVYADGFSIGLYPLPANVPVLSERENVEIFIFGVVRNNGIGSNPIEYPFYEPIMLEVPFEPFDRIPVDLEFHYSDQTRIIQIGDFETSNNFNVNADGNPDISFVRSGETPYGNFCGKITLTPENPSFEKTTLSKIERTSVTNSSVFLEMDYKSEIPFAVGILRIEAGGFFVPYYKLVLNEQDEWNKLYLELTSEINDNQIEEFTILLGSNQSSSGFGSVWVDNLRLLHF